MLRYICKVDTNVDQGWDEILLWQRPGKLYIIRKIVNTEVNPINVEDEIIEVIADGKA